MRNRLKNSDAKKLECYTGHVKKSPCRDCKSKKHLPKCSNSCKIINQLQAALVDIVSCSNNYSELESFSISSQRF